MIRPHKKAHFMKTYAQKLYLDVKALYVSISHLFITQMFFCYLFSFSAGTLASSFRKVTNNDFYVFCEKNLFSLCVWLGMAAVFKFQAHFKTAKFILERVVWISKSCDTRTAHGLQTVSLRQVHKTWWPRTKMLLLSPFSEE